MLTAVSIIFGPAAAHVLVSVVTIALGAFVGASPRQAAKIWGSQRLANLAPERRAFVRWYRAFGILLFLAGLLFAADSIVFSTLRSWSGIH